jgi:hypothetical protein
VRCARDTSHFIAGPVLELMPARLVCAIVPILVACLFGKTQKTTPDSNLNLAMKRKKEII